MIFFLLFIHRKATFVKNYRFISEHNAKNEQFTLNPFDPYNDMDINDFVRVRTGLKRPNQETRKVAQTYQNNRESVASPRSYPATLGEISSLDRLISFS